MAVTITRFASELPQTDDFKPIVLNHTPLIDVRAPVEFNQGAFSTATNLPLMNDEERQKVGLCYKQHGHEAAVKLGHKLVNEQVREPRIQAWIDFIDAHPGALLYCFRGGMRSKIAQQWLRDHNRSIVRLKGGYKAFRRYLIDRLDSVPDVFTQKGIQPIVLAGRTGSGKTQVLQQVHNTIDLEGLAHHRGSAFGRHATPQPTQINFENTLAMAFIRFLETQAQHLIIEDEGRNIGTVNLSKGLFEFLKSGERIVLETPLDERIAITLDEYVRQAQQEYASIDDWQAFMQSALARIQKRLGGERYQRVATQFNDALQQQRQTGSTEFHRSWIKTLLLEYYDPMYDYQMQKRQHKVTFSGSKEEVIEYLKHKH
ncbi:tRNA 2-selenouridine(34) synthase MnmH [Thiomicrorhabdus sp. zzn3]|uniref:tRNA 2-selenouridine(34) synthase MnmH n=1 Tax=Thiomicrorhabdus sp. zzn3 TaxID=3039775 RepID=UPI00243722F5|nr:tRNA 2-selenouridine(34) synthase MnmH [Thiomicrorhabdus sp. zzn3]MDG6778595.1 tRNA 2-selenouridine(34) synthase MnmH [Thiomicrorhabdus sp. zzn3]